VPTLPWNTDGWWEQASAWIRDAVRTAGDDVRSAVRLRTSGSSLVARVEGEHCEFFFKAGLPAARQEAPLLALLRARHPGNIPEVVAFDPLRHWMITRAIRGRSLFHTGDVAAWTTACYRFGAIQRDFASHVGDLVAVGCPTIAPWQLVDELNELLACDAPAAAALPLTASERQRLHAAAPHWRAHAERSDVAGIPMTLDHPDLHPHNVLVSEGGCVYLDWEDAAVSHPFFTVLTLLGYVTRLLPEMRHATVTLRDAYLDAWSGLVERPALVETFEALRPVACVKFAVGLRRARAQLGQDGLPGARVRDTITDCLRLALACDNQSSSRARRPGPRHSRGAS
jgi:hypothetical protein